MMLRKLTLTTHVTASVGWAGAVAIASPPARLGRCLLAGRLAFIVLLLLIHLAGGGLHGH